MPDFIYQAFSFKKRLSLFDFCLLPIYPAVYMNVSEDIDVQMLNEFQQGRLELLYRRLYPNLLLYTECGVQCMEKAMAVYVRGGVEVFSLYFNQK